jgi:hypothetical protein
MGACGSDNTPSSRGPSRILTATGGSSGNAGGTAGTAGLGTGGAGGRGGSGTHGGTGGTLTTGGTLATGGTKTNGGKSNRGGSGGTHPVIEAGAGQGGESAGGEAGQLETGGTSAGGGNGGTAGVSCDQSVTTLASVPEAWALAVDAGYAYFTSNQLEGSVARVPVTGGNVEPIATDELFPHNVAAANGLVFWAALGTEAGHLIQATTSGSDRHELLTDPPSNPDAPGATSGILFVAADATNIYYTANFNDIHARSIATGTDLALSQGPYDSLIVDAQLHGSNLFWTNDGVSAFQTPEAQTAVVARAGISGATAAVSLESRLDYPQFEIAVDDSHVFWSDESAIYSTSLDGGDFQTIVPLPVAPSGESPIVDMISDGSALFFTDGTSIYRVAVAGGTVTLVTSGWTSIEHLALTDSSLLFTDSKRGVVASVAKCAGTTSVPFGSGGMGGQGSGGASSQAGTGGVSQGGTGQGGASQGGATALGGASAQGGVAGGAGASDCGGHGCPAATLAAAVPNAYGLAIDANYLYASEYSSSGNIVRIPLTGGDAEPIVTGVVDAYDIAVDAENVYVALNDIPAGHVVSALKTGGTAQPLVTGVGAGGTGRVTSDGEFVYYVTGYNSIYRVDKNAGFPAVIAAGPYNSVVTDVAVDGTDAYWLNNGIFNSTYTAMLPDTAYVGAAPVSGRADLGHHGLSTSMNNLQRIAVDRTNVYFIDGTSVYRHPRAGGPTVVLGAIAPASGTIGDLLADGAYVYFADKTGVYRMPITGGSTETLTYGWGHILSLVTDSSSVYFTDSVAGAVMKHDK